VGEVVEFVRDFDFCKGRRKKGGDGVDMEGVFVIS
jgi:hypothetical protein